LSSDDLPSIPETRPFPRLRALVRLASKKLKQMRVQKEVKKKREPFAPSFTTKPCVENKVSSRMTLVSQTHAPSRFGAEIDADA
jgi:hypothetical protein